MKRLALLLPLLALAAAPARAADPATNEPADARPGFPELGVFLGMDFRTFASARTNAMVLSAVATDTPEGWEGWGEPRPEWIPASPDSFGEIAMEKIGGIETIYLFSGTAETNRLVEIVHYKPRSARDEAVRGMETRFGRAAARKFFWHMGVVQEVYGWKGPGWALGLSVPVRLDESVKAGSDGLSGLDDLPVSIRFTDDAFDRPENGCDWSDPFRRLFDPAVPGTAEKPFVLLPELPAANRIAGYAQHLPGERVRNVDRSVGDAIFSLLDGYRDFGKSGPFDNAADESFGNGSIWLYFARENCTTSSVWISSDGAWVALTDDFVHLSVPEDRRAALRAALAPLAEADERENQRRTEILKAHPELARPKTIAGRFEEESHAESAETALHADSADGAKEPAP